MTDKTDNIAKRSAAQASANSSSSVSSDSTRDLTQGDVSAHLTRLTGFMMLSMMSFMVASLVETLYIGWVGTNELAAISFTFPVIYTLQGVSMGLGIGASSVVARSVGLGDHVRVRRVVTHVIVLGTTISLVMAVGTSFLLYDIFSLLGAEGVVLDLVVDYMWIWLIGLPVFTMTFVGTTLMRATGDAKTPGYLSALGSILHMAIAPFCIFGYGPIPAMGLEGAAISFIVARQLAFILFIYCFIFRDRMMGISMNGFFDSCRDILHVGLPAVASNMIMPFGMSVVTRLLAGHGVIVVAGYGVASRVESLLVMVIWAVGMSIAPLVGQNWGASAFNRVRTAMRLGGIFVMAWGGLCYATFYLLGEQMISLINDDPEVIHQAYTYLVIGTLAVGFMGLMNIATNSFNALGKPMPPLILSALQMVVLNIPIILIGDYIWGYRGIYAGGVLTSVVLSIVAWIWLHRTIDANSR
ncbi:MAG: MATE family efflux transporter [Pseudomonadota bacterium]|nr:MATE family efflux transporter [Pseudomonadota bacterium]